MKQIFELISHLLLYLIIPFILIVYGVVLLVLMLGYAFSYIFDWTEKKRSWIIHKILFPLQKR